MLSQEDIVAWFGVGLIQFGRSPGIGDFLLAEFGKEGNGHEYVAVGKGMDQRLKAAAVGGHVYMVALREVNGIGGGWC